LISTNPLKTSQIEDKILILIYLIIIIINTCKTMFWKAFSNLFDGKSARNGLVAIPRHLVYKENK
jgi:hypothetical protein